MYGIIKKSKVFLILVANFKHLSFLPHNFLCHNVTMENVEK